MVVTRVSPVIPDFIIDVIMRGLGVIDLAIGRFHHQTVIGERDFIDITAGHFHATDADAIRSIDTKFEAQRIAAFDIDQAEITETKSKIDRIDVVSAGHPTRAALLIPIAVKPPQAFVTQFVDGVQQDCHCVHPQGRAVANSDHPIAD